ncbi:DNA-3-methyladenine glycosylase family protein [Leptospira idonii]|uniref:DNA-3-methyladenine glycosylase II n=1 Tax=Leptospira idonii TaxID=1193500 RepID=A0A4R9LV19_9LEPT|nr:DNA glycosylase [Leptospira idonii]TGN17993.1 DNA-3-methyladenine glycosylase 2 family protein [Leptospira idonii]
MKPVPKFEVKTPKRFKFEECLWFLDRNYDDCLLRIEKGSVFKLLKPKSGKLLVRIFTEKTKLYYEVIKGEPSQENILFLRDYITEWFDLKRDLTPFYKILNHDPYLSYMTKSYEGLRLIGIPDLFEALSWCIIGQQINLTFAYTLKRRLTENYGEKLKFKDHTYYLFPKHSVLADLTVDELRKLQFSGKKAEYIIGIAKSFSEGKINKNDLVSLPDLESKQKFLTQWKGVGIWTANYSLMKSLREPSCIPYGDVGLWNALERHRIIQNRNEKEKLTEFFEPYKGWESYLVFYLWRSLSEA